MKITLIRHAESEGNANPLVYTQKSDQAIELSAKGVEQCAKLSRNLLDLPPINKILCSPFRRAKQTMETVLGQHLKFTKKHCAIEENPLLVERAWGKLRERVAKRQHTPEDFEFFTRHEGGESFADLYQRVSLFRQILFKDWSENNSSHTACFTHGEWIKVWIMIEQQMSVEDFAVFSRTRKIANCECLTYRY